MKASLLISFAAVLIIPSHSQILLPKISSGLKKLEKIATDIRYDFGITLNRGSPRPPPNTVTENHHHHPSVNQGSNTLNNNVFPGHFDQANDVKGPYHQQGNTQLSVSQNNFHSGLKPSLPSEKVEVTQSAFDLRPHPNSGSHDSTHPLHGDTKPNASQSNVHSDLKQTHPSEPQSNVHSDLKQTHPTEPPSNVHSDLKQTHPTEPQSNVHSDLKQTHPTEPQSNVHSDLKQTHPSASQSNVHSDLKQTHPTEPQSNVHSDLKQTHPSEPQSNVHSDLEPASESKDKVKVPGPKLGDGNTKEGPAAAKVDFPPGPAAAVGGSGVIFPEGPSGVAKNNVTSVKHDGSVVFPEDEFTPHAAAVNNSRVCIKGQIYPPDHACGKSTDARVVCEAGAVLDENNKCRPGGL